MESMYFSDDVTKAIIEFKYEKSKEKRNEIFVERIMPAFEKLIKYHYHRSHIAKNEEIMQDCMSYLFEKIPKYEEDKYDHAFPYFNIIVRNYFIQISKAESRQIQNDQYPISLTDIKQQQGKLEEYAIDDIETKIEFEQFLESFKDHLHKWRNHFQKPQEVKIIDALIIIFENADNLELYNKKAIFWYLKELTNLKSKQIATNLAKIKRKYELLKKKYNRGDI